MDVLAKKSELIDWLLKLKDENKINKFLALKTIIEKETVAYTVKGYPVDKEEYLHLVQESDERISSGQFTSIEDLEKEIEKW